MAVRTHLKKKPLGEYTYTKSRLKRERGIEKNHSLESLDMNEQKKVFSPGDM